MTNLTMLLGKEELSYDDFVAEGMPKNLPFEGDFEDTVLPWLLQESKEVISDVR